MKKLTVLLILILTAITASAQGNDIEMADKLRGSGMIYVVIATIVIIFAGITVYLFSLDRRLKKIEKEK